MSQTRRSQQKIQTTTIPLHLSINPNLGILKFILQKSSQRLQNPTIQMTKFQQQITYKNAVGKQSDNQSDEQQYKKRKTVNLNRVIIKSSKWDRKYYKADIPINKYTGVHGRNRDRIHFVLHFGNQNQGQLTMIDDVYDCQVNVMTDHQEKIMTFDEKVKMQNVKLDARRREERVQVVMEKKDNRKKQK